MLTQGPFPQPRVTSDLALKFQISNHGRGSDGSESSNGQSQTLCFLNFESKFFGIKILPDTFL